MCGAVAGPPFLRHPIGECPEVCAVDLLGPAKDRLKGFPARYVLIDRIAGIDTPERRIGKVPF